MWFWVLKPNPLYSDNLENMDKIARKVLFRRSTKSSSKRVIIKEIPYALYLCHKEGRFQISLSSVITLLSRWQIFINNFEIINFTSNVNFTIINKMFTVPKLLKKYQ